MNHKISPKSFIKKYSISVPKKKNRKQIKITDKNFEIVTFKNYENLLNNNYRVSQLKLICRHYKLKIGGNKDELIFRIYNYLRLSRGALPFQKRFRLYLAKLYVECRGANWSQPSKWINKDDFLTLTPMIEVYPIRYFTHKSNQTQIYCFDMISLAKYFKKTKTFENPFTREKFSQLTINKLNKTMRLSKILHISLKLEEEVKNEENVDENIQHRFTRICQTIDSFGHYTNTEWFCNLSKPLFIKYLRELRDIWGYRAHLSLETKREICPPHGNPFNMISINRLHNAQLNDIKTVVLNILEKLATTGVTHDA